MAEQYHWASGRWHKPLPSRGTRIRARQAWVLALAKLHEGALTIVQPCGMPGLARSAAEERGLWVC